MAIKSARHGRRKRSARGSWLDLWPDHAVVLDFANQRYALPALDGEGEPILTRAQGVFPKRVVGLADVMSIKRYAFPDDDGPGGFTQTLWRTYRDGAWSLIGGDGLGIGVPRIETWFGDGPALMVEPSAQFNRVQYAEDDVFPKNVGLAREAQGYMVSWIGNDDLVVTIPTGTGAGSTTLAALDPDDPERLNWAYVPQIVGYTAAHNTFARAGNPGTVAHSLQAGSVVDVTARSHPTTMIHTTAQTVAGPPIYAHVERSGERVQLHPDVVALLTRPAPDPHIRTGTLIIDQRQLALPPAGARRVAFGAGEGTAGPQFDRAALAFYEDGGDYSLRFEGIYGQALLPVDGAAITGRARLGLVTDYAGDIRRIAMTGAGAVTVAGGGAGWASGYAPYMQFASAPGDDARDLATEHAGNSGGAGAFYSLAWTPEALSEAALAAAVG